MRQIADLEAEIAKERATSRMTLLRVERLEEQRLLLLHSQESTPLSTLSLGGAARVECRPWDLESALFVVTGGVISAAVVVAVAVADSAVSWHFRWPGGLWRPLLGLSEHAEPRRCY